MGIADDYSNHYGIRSSMGNVKISDAKVNITKLGEYGDGIYADYDILISGTADIDIIDWSTGEAKCGLSSGRDTVIGDTADVNICSQSTGIRAYGKLYIGYIWDGAMDGDERVYVAGGSPTVKINDPGTIAEITPLTADDFKNGAVGIKTSGDVVISGSSTVLNINTGIAESLQTPYGIRSSSGSVKISDAKVNITKLGEYGDVIYARKDIIISGAADIDLIDWSTGEEDACGLYSRADIAIGDNADVNICSQSAGISADGKIYIGYIWDGAAYIDERVYVAGGSPTVIINDADKIAAITPATADDFKTGLAGMYSTSDMLIAGGTVDATGLLYTIHSVKGDISISGGNVTALAKGGFTEKDDHDSGLGDSVGFLSMDGKIIISGGSVSATASGDRNNAGIYGTAGVQITGGTVTATAAASSKISAGIYSKEDISMSGGILTSIGEKGAFNSLKDTYSFPAISKYKSSSSPSDPGGAYTYGTYTYRVDDSFVFIATTNAITRLPALNGSFTTKVDNAAVDYAALGETVALVAVPDSGFMLSSWNVYKTSESTTLYQVTDNSFTMPTYAVSVSATFIKVTSGSSGGNTTPDKTIKVTETSSPLFKGSAEIKVTANMTDAFSNSVEVKVGDTPQSTSSFGLGTGDTVYPFDISLYIKGTNTKIKPKDGYAVTISLPVPASLLKDMDKLYLVHKSDTGVISKINFKRTQIGGVWYMVFDASEFSPYAIVVSSFSTYSEADGIPYYLDKDKEVYIALAANGKYIAPKNVTVSFKQNTKSFNDVSGHWAAKGIAFVTEREVFMGTEKGLFSPEQGMTRAMFATVIGRIYERSYGAIELTGTSAFTDCNYDDYYGKYVDWCEKNSIISGVGGNSFEPNGEITREEMAAILYRFVTFLNVKTGSKDNTLKYPDATSISDWAKDAALFCQSTGLITGADGGAFAPYKTATRAEVATITQRLVNLILG